MGCLSATPGGAAGLVPVGAVAVLLGGCVAAVPALTGGSTTHEERGDLLVGGSARIPVDEPLDGNASSSFPGSAAAGGVAPTVGFRYGVAPHWDLGLILSGTTARIDLRRERVLREAITRPSVLLGVGVLVGWTPDEGVAGEELGSGFRVGAELPVYYAVEFGGVYDLWVGARAAAEYVGGEFTAVGTGTTAENASVMHYHVGPVLGLAAGIRRIHALLELSVQYEWWRGDLGDLDIEGDGLVFVPAFALRVRI